MSTHDTKMEGHLTDAMVENAMFLMESCGMSLEATARRLGVKANSLEKLLVRRG